MSRLKILLAPPAALLAAASGGPASGAAQPACTGTPSKVRLYVNVEGVRSATGLVAVTLYADDRKRFLARRGSLYVGRAPARSPTTRVCIHLPSTGVWGLAVYHDANANRSFDKNGIGLPAEAFGFSRNAPTLFGLPNFNAVRFNVPRSGLQTTVRLKYP
jgi:uncharacterized protein (DUF2141 family)